MVTVLGERGYLGSVVKRRWLELGDSDHIVNCVRPDNYFLTLGLAGHGLIQPSTDAILEDTEYARQKRIIEKAANGAVIIRAGIVDIRQDYPTAYLNWRCNPLTPLEWAEVAWGLRDSPGLHTAGREILSRYQVAALVAKVFKGKTPYPPNWPAEDWAEVPLDRTQPDTTRWPPLKEALERYRDWLQS